MQFSDAVSSGWKRGLDFKGRSSRSEFWWWSLFAILAGFGAAIIASITGLMFLSYLPALIFLIPNLAITFRRLHDIDKSGWWLLGYFGIAAVIGMISGMLKAPVIAGLSLLILAVIYIIWLCRAGTAGANRYGPDPLATDPAVTEQYAN